MTVSTFLESWIPRSNNPSFLSSLPSFLPPSCPLLRFRGLHHSSASWPPLLGPFNHIWHTHTSKCVHTTDTHKCRHTHTPIVGRRHPRQSSYWFCGFSWNFMVGLSGGFWRLSSCPPKTPLLSFSPSISLFLPFSFPLFFLSSSLSSPPPYFTRSPSRSEISCGLGLIPLDMPSLSASFCLSLPFCLTHTLNVSILHYSKHSHTGNTCWDQHRRVCKSCNCTHTYTLPPTRGQSNM